MKRDELIVDIEKLKKDQNSLSVSVNNYQKQEEVIKKEIKDGKNEIKLLLKNKADIEKEILERLLNKEEIKGLQEEAAIEHNKQLAVSFELDKKIDKRKIDLSKLEKDIDNVQEFLLRERESANNNIREFYEAIIENCEKIKELAK